MNKDVLKNAFRLCNKFNNNKRGFLLKVCKNSNFISKFYSTYDGIKEFLYIPSLDEIKNNISNGSIYLCIIYGKKVAGIVKVSKLNLPHPFFSPPKSMDSSKDYWGVSGLYIHKNFRGKKLANVLIKASTILAKMCGSAGVYADFDYRNVASMKVISKFYNFFGYTDGRNGAVDEATIYTTFFKSFSSAFETKAGAININLDNNANLALKELNRVMQLIGPDSETRVEYGGGYNIIKCFDKPYNFDFTNIKIEEPIKSNVCEVLKNNGKNLDN